MGRSPFERRTNRLYAVLDAIYSCQILNEMRRKIESSTVLERVVSFLKKIIWKFDEFDESVNFEIVDTKYRQVKEEKTKRKVAIKKGSGKCHARCHVCGSGSYLIKKRIVPRQYRRHYPGNYYDN